MTSQNILLGEDCEEDAYYMFVLSGTKFPILASQDSLEFIAGVWNSQETIDYIGHGGLDEATQPYQLKCNDEFYVGWVGSMHV